MVLQIENEFGTWPLGTSEHAYAMWTAKMATSMNTGVPWIMCLQFDAPDPVVRELSVYICLLSMIWMHIFTEYDLDAYIYIFTEYEGMVFLF